MPESHQTNHRRHIGEQAEPKVFVHVIARRLAERLGRDDNRQQTDHVADHRQRESRCDDCDTLPVLLEFDEPVDRR